ncbi:MAG TPA: sigma-70 family RNA polymerase sigma factor [Vicinamibacterales bacterium]|nr:sigma-70 family RNA polymerase sigma factor [Vicinamibacterales bacterium]
MLGPTTRDVTMAGGPSMLGPYPTDPNNLRQTLRMHDSDRMAGPQAGVVQPAGDRTAIARAREGDSEAFRSLVERHSRYVFNVAYRLTASASDAEDVVQTTFLRAFQQLSRFEARADFRTWLHRIAVNCSIDLIRSRRYREVGHDPEDLEFQSSAGDDRATPPGPDRLLLSSEIRDRVSDGLAQLSANERLAFTLRHVEGLPIRDVALAMGLETEAAKNSIFRAVRKMRAALEPFVQVSERRV